MIAEDSQMAHFRHYIYGIPSVRSDRETEEFLTTTLSSEDALKWASSHQNMFRERFHHYSIRLVDIEVCSVK